MAMFESGLLEKVNFKKPDFIKNNAILYFKGGYPPILYTV
jgi:hypothetical protein